MSSLFSIDYGLSNCSGASVHLDPDGTCTINLLKLSVEKKLIQVGTKKTYTGSLEKLKIDSLSEPLSVNITGKGVLIKKTPRLDLVSEQSLQQLFPAMKLSEFYVQHFPSGTHSFVSVVRKEIADAVIAYFKKQGAEVLILSLGAFVADQVIPQINFYDDVLRFNGHQLTLDAEKNWLDYSYAAGNKSDFPLKVDIEPMPEEFLLAYASAFQLLLHDKIDLIEVEDEQLKYRLNDLSAKLKFKKLSMFLLIFFFAVLLINFLLFSSYNSSNQEMVSKSGKKTYLIENRQKMEDDVKKKEALVTGLGWNKGFYYAFLCDQIGSSMPKELILTEFLINTLSVGTDGLSKVIKPEAGKIQIKGQTNSVYAINDWIFALKQKDWVKDVQLERYTADDQKQAQVFTLILSY